VYDQSKKEVERLLLESSKDATDAWKMERTKWFAVATASLWNISAKGFKWQEKALNSSLSKRFEKRGLSRNEAARRSNELVRWESGSSC
jgi:hypothetical protein